MPETMSMVTTPTLWILSTSRARHPKAPCLFFRVPPYSDPSRPRHMAGNACGILPSWTPSKPSSPLPPGYPSPLLMTTKLLLPSSPPRSPRQSISSFLQLSLRGRLTLSGGLCKGFDPQLWNSAAPQDPHCVTSEFSRIFRNYS